MATKDGLAQIWYADANGVITGNTPTADNVASAIIDGYNEHFGTDIQIWTPETITLQVGDTVPNWNAYEKIFNPFIALEQAVTYILGHIVGSEIKIIGNNIDSCIITDNEGTCISSVPAGGEEFISNMIQVVNSVTPFNINSVSIEAISIEIGETVPNFNQYTKYQVSE